MRFAATAFFIGAASLVAYAASVTIPDTPAGHQLSGWLDAFNGGDRAVLLKFLEENRPEAAQRIDQQLGFRSRTGGFDLRKVEESTPARITGLLQEREGEHFARVVLEVDAQPPHHITKLDLNIVPRPPEFAIQKLSETELISQLREKLKKDVAADQFSGAVLLAKNDQVLFSGAYGLADRARGIANTLDTRFRIGSMNKMFTAVAVLQLVEAGKIDLNATVGKYLPDYPNHDVASKVTIHQLLTHTGGTGDIFGPEFDKHRRELKALTDYVKLYGTRAPQFEPGSRFEYSNYGFVLLGIIVARVSGTDYYDYVRDHVYRPAGMSATASLPEDQVVEKRSIGYMKEAPGEDWRPNTDTLPYRATSAGGGYSTVTDLFRFARALEEHKLLDVKYTELLTTGKVNAQGGQKYAYGFFDKNGGGMRSFGHGGGAPGMNGDLRIFPQSGYVVVVLANLDPPAAERIAGFIENRLP